MKCIQLLLKTLNTLSVYRFIKREGDNMEEYESMVIHLRDDLVIEIGIIINEVIDPSLQDPYSVVYFKINGENLW